MIPFAAFLIVTALLLFLLSIIFERPWLKWFMIPFIVLAGVIIYFRLVGVI